MKKAELEPLQMVKQPNKEIESKKSRDYITVDVVNPLTIVISNGKKTKTIEKTHIKRSARDPMKKFRLWLCCNEVKQHTKTYWQKPLALQIFTKNHMKW